MLPEDLSVRVPLSVAGCVLLWLLGAGLLGWETMTGAGTAGRWGLYCTAAAAAWTVLLGNRREHRLVVDAMEHRVRKVIDEEQVTMLDAAR